MFHEVLHPIDPREVERPYYRYFEVWEHKDAIIDDQIGIVATGLGTDDKPILRIISPRSMAISVDSYLDGNEHISHASILSGIGSVVRSISYENKVFIGESYELRLVEAESGFMGLRVFSDKALQVQALDFHELAIDYLRQRFNDVHPGQFQ